MPARKDREGIMNSSEIELAIATHLDFRQHLIVPNISWGFGLPYEADLVVVTASGYAWEIEIKVSKGDLRADLKKRHGHYSTKFKRLYFAVPHTLIDDAVKFAPERAGLFSVENNYVRLVRAPKINRNSTPLTEQEIENLYKLASMRIWTLKRKLLALRENCQRRNSNAR